MFKKAIQTVIKNKHTNENKELKTEFESHVEEFLKEMQRKVFLRKFPDYDLSKLSKLAKIIMKAPGQRRTKK